MPITLDAVRRRRDAALGSLRARFPQYGDPRSGALGPNSNAHSGTFAEVGAYDLILAETTEAKRWFRMARDANLVTYRHERSKAPGWPSGPNAAAPRLLWPVATDACRYGRLVDRDPAQAPYARELRDALPDLARSFEEEMREALRRPPNLRDLPSHSLLLAYKNEVLRPALVLEDPAALKVARAFLERIIDWNGGLKATPATLEKRGYWVPVDAGAMLALLDGDGPAFLKGFVHSNSLGKYYRAEMYKELCNVDVLSWFLQANEMVGPLSPRGIRGIPPDFDVEAYWSA